MSWRPPSDRPRVPAFRYRRYELQIGSTDNLPPCPSCHNGHYDTIRGGDAADDPYPDRKS